MRSLSRLLMSVAVLWACLHPSSSMAQEPVHKVVPEQKYAVKLRNYEEFVRQEMERNHIPGLAIGFIKDGYMWCKGFGYADIENKVPAKADSAFRLASVTKTMTAVAVLQLVERGKIDLDSEIQTYVPYFPKKKWPITVRQLLLHLSGLRHNVDSEKSVTRHLTTREAVAQYADSEFVAEPGTKFSYSSPGYVLLGAAIEGASGQAYEDYMRQHIWAPLGMRNTRMDDPTDIIPNRVRGYRLIDGEVKNSQAVDVSNRFAAGGIRTTVIDTLKFVQGLNSGKLLSKTSMDLMSTSGATHDGGLTYTGMGWFFDFVNGRYTLTNNGGQQETRTVVYNFPKANFSIALAMNFEFNDYMPFVKGLYQSVLDEPWTVSWEKNIATKDTASDNLIRIMQEVSFNGLADFDRNRIPNSENPTELTEALTYFNKITDARALSLASGEIQAEIDTGFAPHSNQPLLKLGSFMAARLSRSSNARRFENYHSSGTIPFFADYIAMYRVDTSYPKGLRFSATFESQINKWNRSWTKTDDQNVQRLMITSASDVQDISRRLRRLMIGAEVYPYLNREITSTTWQLILKGDTAGANTSAHLSADLYPQSDQSHMMLGIVSVTRHEQNGARSELKEAAKINGDNVAFGRALDSYAHGLSDAGRIKDGLELLQLTVEMFPKDAGLHASMGELYLKMGNKQKAIESYKNALGIDANHELSKRMLEELELPN